MNVKIRIERGDNGCEPYEYPDEIRQRLAC